MPKERKRYRKKKTPAALDLAAEVSISCSGPLIILLLLLLLQ
ncbi:hypothetical protein [Nocardia beijingensis]